MKRHYALTLCTFNLPCISANLRKMHFAGLGDGSVVDTKHERLRGGGGANNNNRRGNKNKVNWSSAPNQDDDKISSRFIHSIYNANEQQQSPRINVNNEHQRIDDLDDEELIDYIRKKGSNRRVANKVHQKDSSTLHVIHHNNDASDQQQQITDGPWQLSVLMLLGIMGVLLGLFVHFSTDPSAHHFRRRMKKKHYFHHSPSYKKKTDEWSEDEEVTEDDNYRGDNEGTVVEEQIIAKKRASPVPTKVNDPTANLYYQLNTSDSFRQQESRLRKSAGSQSSSQQQQSQSSANSCGTKFRRPESLTSAFNSPARPRSTVSAAIIDNTNNRQGIDKAKSFPQPPYDRSGIGSGLEGFTTTTTEHSQASSCSTSSGAPERNTNHQVIMNSTLVKPMGTFSPTESFAFMSRGSDISTDTGQRDIISNTPKPPKARVGEVNFNSPDENSKSFAIPASKSPSPSWNSGNYNNNSQTYSREMAELPTPRVDHTKGKRDLSRVLKDHKISGVPLPPSLSSDGSDEPLHCRNKVESMSSPNDEEIENIAKAFPGMPLVPNLSHDNNAGVSDGSAEISPTVDDAPRSVLLEELQLVRMESGVSGPRWKTTYESSSIEEQQRQEKENMKKLRESSTDVDPADDPRNSIQHIRKDLTISSDASSSLSSRIAFSELKLEDVIGGGGFGQVWRAKWKGTPVAVKVLTGTAQAETVSKAVLEEFIAEINMVSGMRHPNICLFIGACLDPPNRAIITELCDNGSLWDALRSPVATYQLADGKSRLAWPLNIYETSTVTPPPTFQGGSGVVKNLEPPLAPEGSWPWVLVKRVASGTARGMCYLHSGNPPVLHRDLKSANILLDESYTAKLADFGLSRLKAVRSGMTGNCGTVQWMAPEVLCNEDYAEPADVFR